MMAADDVTIQLIRQTRLMLFDFDGVFTDNAVYVAEDGTEMVRCTRFDGFGLRALERLGIRLLVLSTEANPVVGMRCRKLGIDFTQGLADKRAVAEQLIRDAGLTSDQVAYVGNDINDLGCLELVGLPIIVADAHQSVRHAGRLQTTIPGGHGAVREIADLYVSIRANT